MSMYMHTILTSLLRLTPNLLILAWYSQHTVLSRVAASLSMFSLSAPTTLSTISLAVSRSRGKRVPWSIGSVAVIALLVKSSRSSSLGAVSPVNRALA